MQPTGPPGVIPGLPGGEEIEAEAKASFDDGEVVAPAPARWQIWFEAARPRTLPAAVAPVVVGSALAWHAGHFVPAAAALCLGFGLLIQIGTNFANDYYDYFKGADTVARVGPRRAVAAGLISPQSMRGAMI